jgi:putative transposase
VKGVCSDRELYRVAGVSKSTFYRVVRAFGGVPLSRLAGCVRVGRRPGRCAFVVTPEVARRVIETRLLTRANDRTIAAILKSRYGLRVGHGVVYRVLREAGLIHMRARLRKRRSWVRFERRHSLSLWQLDWTLFQGRCLLIILDDASRLVVGWRLCDHATSHVSVDVLKEAITRYGRPKAVLTGRDVQFYSSGGKGRVQGTTVFQDFLEANHIMHTLARVNHPQTCGKVERWFGELKKRIRWNDFKTVDEVVHWHNEIKPHLSLDMDRLETPHQAFQRKMHHNRKPIHETTEA